jgi:hypothetical protein
MLYETYFRFQKYENRPIYMQNECKPTLVQRSNSLYNPERLILSYKLNVSSTIKVLITQQLHGELPLQYKFTGEFRNYTFLHHTYTGILLLRQL